MQPTWKRDGPHGYKQHLSKTSLLLKAVVSDEVVCGFYRVKTQVFPSLTNVPQEIEYRALNKITDLTTVQEASDMDH